MGMIQSATKQFTGGEASRLIGKRHAESFESLDPHLHPRVLRVHVRAEAEPIRFSQDGRFEPYLHPMTAFDANDSSMTAEVARQLDIGMALEQLVTAVIESSPPKLESA